LQTQPRAKRLACLWGGFATLLLSICAWAQKPAAIPPIADTAATEFFEAKVRPILAASCTRCHGPQDQMGGLRLDSRAALLKGGKRGATVKAGNPAESL